MNFLAEVISSADTVQMINVKKKTPQIISQIGNLKCEVKKYMESVHVDFKQFKKRSNNLLNEANNLNNEMDALHNQIENLVKKNLECTSNELANLLADLAEAKYALTIAAQLVQIDDYLVKTNEFMSNKKYLNAAQQIRAAKEVINEIPEKEELAIVQAAFVSLTIEHENLLHETGKIWKEAVVTNKQVLENEIIATIRIKTSSSDDLEQSIQALCCENPLIFELLCLSNFLLDEILTPIINNNTAIDTIEDGEYFTLSVKISKSSPKLPYMHVFDNIRTVIDYLAATINFQIREDLLLLGSVGNKISEQFCAILIKDCLADTVPSTPKGLESYNEVISDIESLQSTLIEHQFFNKENKSLLEYTNNVDVLFAKKMCQEYLDKARKILKKDLHDMVEVGVDTNVTSSTKEVHNFPKCCISRSTCEYQALAVKMLDQASVSSELCAGRLLNAVSHLFEIYWQLVPEYHKKLLETIPQQVALFHNNCMYLAHELLTINIYYKEQISKAIEGESFSAQVTYLRSAGTDAFLKHLRSQVKQIEDILKDSELTKLAQTDKLDPKCEQSVRQCLRQLELLKTVWQKVLSYEVYHKSIGELLNCFVEYLMQLVIGVEDISSNNCTLLVDIFGIVKTRGPKLFTEPKEINMYVKYWYKFTELILLLNSNLSDINDRWADGAGPLAVEFRPEEVKSLIRALFQNTDRRAAVLARIM